MRIQHTANEIVISLPKGLMSVTEIQHLIDYFRYRELVANESNTTISLLDKQPKKIVKEALIESMTEQQDIWLDLIREALEDYALGQAIEEGIENKPVSREDVFKAFKPVD